MGGSTDGFRALLLRERELIHHFVTPLDPRCVTCSVPPHGHQIAPRRTSTDETKQPTAMADKH
jgi:hypothetical protein